MGLRRRVLGIGFACSLLVMAGCGDDGTTDSESAEAAAATGEELPDCEPVNADMEGDAATVVDVALTDFAFSPVAIEVDAGIVTFATSNDGGSVHEFAVLPGGGEVPFIEPGMPDEEALEAAGAFEMEGYAPGETCNATWELEAGEYTLFCIIDAGDGETHYEKGMEGTLTVRG